MAITTLSMVLTVLVLNLNAISERPVPYWVRVVILDYIGKLFCRCGTPSISARNCEAGGEREDGGRLADAEEDLRGTGLLTEAQKMRMAHYRNSMLRDDLEEEVPVIALNGNVPSAQETSFVFLGSRRGTDNGGATGVRVRSPRGTRHVEEKEKPPDYSKDWQQLAEIVDRLFFWSFLLVIIAISLLLFHPLTKHHSVSEKVGPPQQPLPTVEGL